ncbi:MAG: hypothetical protein PUB52_10330 [Lachnospiraceae bacterium]|nr:hypothetical protein [Lachnospiraceae bacterium]
MKTQSSDSNYNFILVGKPLELYRYAYMQVESLDYAFFDSSFTQNKIVSLFNRLYWSTKINQYITLPFKKKWLKHKIKKFIQLRESMPAPKKPICFLLFSTCVPWEKFDFSAMLKKTFPDCKIIYYFSDLVEINPIRKKFVQEIPNSIDLIYTYDLGDARKYNLRYYHFPYSDISDIYPKHSPMFDISFVGQAKNRLNEIVDAYTILRDKGYTCDFYVVGVPRKKQILKKEIHYCNWISYKRYLKIVQNSKVILEVVQKNSRGSSVRVNDAIVFKKVLISNNPFLRDDPLFSESYIYIYETLNELAKFQLIPHAIFPKKYTLYPSEFFKRITNDLK